MSDNKDKEDKQTETGQWLSDMMDEVGKFLVGSAGVGKYHDQMSSENIEKTVTERSNPKKYKKDK